MKMLSEQRKEELLNLFWREERDLIPLTWLIENCEKYKTQEMLQEWEFLFEEKLRRANWLLKAPPKLNTREWRWWIEDAEYELQTRRRLHSQTDYHAWLKYASLWRDAPEKEQAGILFKLLLKFADEMGRGKIYGKIPRNRAPKNSLELAYVEGLIAPNLCPLLQARRKQKRKMSALELEHLRSGFSETKKEKKRMAQIVSRQIANRIKGTETTKQNKNKRKETFRKMYLEEKKRNGTLYTKDGLIQTVLPKYNAENKPITKRTAWSYVSDLK